MGDDDHGGLAPDVADHVRQVGRDVRELAGPEHRVLLQALTPPEPDFATRDEACALDSAVQMAGRARTRGKLGARQAETGRTCRTRRALTLVPRAVL